MSKLWNTYVGNPEMFVDRYVSRENQAIWQVIGPDGYLSEPMYKNEAEQLAIEKNESGKDAYIENIVRNASEDDKQAAADELSLGERPV